MHASTRVLLLMAAIGLLLGGLWVLFSINTTIVATVYGIGWAIAILLGTRILLAVGSGYNRLRGRRTGLNPGAHQGSAAALTELADLRERELITPEEFEAKRAAVVDRL